ncbi:hypothetical protein CHS0354_032719 [Potamilus streckersoni]|uniref:Uncharacterized protein n=1 Tax=Potamilus streckersoni TaxID=2493646 RepID=A0AAE0VHG6_9BIVA|nr:hypothetical protein CHS0354_032719 [Potamilus streckersoni]
MQGKYEQRRNDNKIEKWVSQASLTQSSTSLVASQTPYRPSRRLLELPSQASLTQSSTSLVASQTPYRPSRRLLELLDNLIVKPKPII